MNEKTTKIKCEPIANALRKLGIKRGKVFIQVRRDSARVFLNGKYFGIFDFSRNTFAD